MSKRYEHLLSPFKIGNVVIKNRTLFPNASPHFLQGPENYPAEGLVPYMERFLQVPGASIQFRFDYTATTPDNLYEEKGDKILADLKNVAAYTGLDGCRMRNGFHFEYKGMELTYHKTLPYSTIVETDPADGVTYDILYDILIKQTGAIHSDWTGVELDVDAYEKVVYEPYDLKWIVKN